MTEEDAWKVQLAAALLAAYLRGDPVGLDVLLFDEFDDRDVNDYTDGFFLLSVAAGQMVSQLSGQSFAAVLTEMPRKDFALLPVEPAWDQTLGYIAEIQAGQPPSRLDFKLDIPTALATTFNIGCLLTTEVARHVGKSPADMATIFATMAASET